MDRPASEEKERVSESLKAVSYFCTNSSEVVQRNCPLACYEATLREIPQRLMNLPANLYKGIANPLTNITEGIDNSSQIKKLISCFPGGAVNYFLPLARGYRKSSGTHARRYKIAYIKHL
jgi:hypothetical protein